MRVFESRAALRWAVPVAFVVVAGGTGIIATSASADPHLPPRDAKQLLVDLQSVEVDHLSGTIEETADLGLPSIPGASGSDSTEFNSLLSGKHTVGLWLGGEGKARFALQGSLGESDVISNGTDLWTWNSKSQKATHTTRPADSGDPKTAKPDGTPKTPQEAAQLILDAIDDTTTVTTDSAVTVAGQPAYELVVRPSEKGSLVTEARLAIDAQTHLPLRVQVFAGSTTVFSTEFTSIDYSQPDAKYFTFTPPEGTKVTEVAPPTGGSHARPNTDGKTGTETGSSADEPTIVGKGWTTVIIAKVPTDLSAAGGQEARQLASVLSQLPRVSGDWGSGRQLTGKAFTAVLTDDGRLAVGSVSADVLYAALKK